MTINDFIIHQSQGATFNLFAQARRVPEDKLTWAPEGQGRSVLNLCAECALSPRWGPMVVEAGGLKMGEEEMAAFNAAVAALTTLDECERLAHENLAYLVDFVRSVPAERMDEIIAMPFGPKEWPIAQILMLHQWNCTYHIGQICYIQTLYGDKEMG